MTVVATPGDTALLGRKRCDDFFKTRVTAEGIPKRQKLQLTVSEPARGTNGDSQLFAGEILLTNPSGDHRQILDHCDAINRIFFNCEKLDCTTAFAQRLLLPPQGGVDQSQHTQRRTVMWLGLDDFLLLRARSGESPSRLVFILAHTSDNAFYEWTSEINSLIAEGRDLTCRDSRSFCG